ncbi:E3 ubiquitin-protein ligase RING1-like [Chenopodium quinoa]|uniref:RING-type E3 ubiquitin transferase n=1 Tax=Chenopodium quinoa TaxID=63459 RepID=A0A803KUT1_CHEQI|nr:E3 ubiquitin-protein ligase RING1-like [Chenopodium quinoa]
MSSLSHDDQQLVATIFRITAEDFLMGMEDPSTEFRYNREFLIILYGVEDMTEDGVIPTGVVPADESFVASLEIKKASEELANSGEVCSVCLEGWKVGDDVKYSPCKHCFHPACVDKWFKINHFCPLCRFELPPTRDARA